MVRLNADAQYPGFTHGIAAPRHISDFGPSQYQIFVTHDLGHGGGYFRDDGPLHWFQLRCACCIIQNEFAELTYSHALDGLKGVLVKSLENQAADIVGGWVD